MLSNNELYSRKSIFRQIFGNHPDVFFQVFEYSPMAMLISTPKEGKGATVNVTSPLHTS